MHPLASVAFFISFVSCFLDGLGPFSLLKINEDEIPISTQEIYPECYFKQIVDHYAKDKEYYLQRYFVNDKHYRPGGPAFLFIGGESKISSTWVWWGQLAEAAKTHGGIIFALEHRYYGKSFPTKDLSVENLKFLSSDQALKDLKLFIKGAPIPNVEGSEKKLIVPSCWIVAGGSYPGNLAAWARYLFPNLIRGAIASSAPVLAKENFYEYDRQVTHSLRRHGGTECAHYFHEVYELIDQELLNGGPKRSTALKKRFGMESLSNEEFAMNLDFISGIVQYNRPTRGNGVQRLCSTLSLRASPEEKLSEFISIVRRQQTLPRMQKMLRMAGEENIPDENSLWRQWLYQCCTEFGYWQVAPPKGHKAVRSRAATYDDWDRLFCGDVYGKSFRQGPDVNATNSHYLGKKLDIGNIFWVNGELDPWMPLSVTSRAHHHPRPFVIRNASHAMDLSADHPLDWDDLALAKSLIKRHIAHWVESKHVTKHESIYSTLTTYNKMLLVAVGMSAVAVYNIRLAIRNNIASTNHSKS